MILISYIYLNYLNRGRNMGANYRIKCLHFEYEEFIFSDSTSLYFYSAWLQANAAMFAIVFFLIIYKLQSLSTVINNIKMGIILASNMTIDGETMRMFDNLNTREEAIDNVDDDYWKEQLKIMSSSIEKTKNIRALVRPLFYILPISLMVNAVMITLSSLIHNLGYCYEAVSFIVVLIFQFFVLYKLISVSKIAIFRHSEI